MPELFDLSCELNRPHIPAVETVQILYGLIHLVPGEFVERRRMPINFCLLLDCSPSMEGEKLQTMQAVASRILENLDPHDTVSIIRFAEDTTLLYPAGEAKDKAALLKAIENLALGDDTLIAPAIQESLVQISKHDSPDRISRIVLLTDGDPTDEEASRDAASQAGERGIPIIVLGIGTDWKEDYLIELADRSVCSLPGSQAGYIDYVRSPEQAAQVFENAFQSMQVIAKELLIKIRAVEGVKIRHVYQTEPVFRDIPTNVIRQGRMVDLPVGDLEKTGTEFAVELEVAAQSEGEHLLLIASADCIVPKIGRQTYGFNLEVPFTRDAELANQQNERVTQVFQTVNANTLKMRALSDYERGEIEKARKKLKSAAELYLKQGDSEMAAQLESEVLNLEQRGQLSAEGHISISLTARHRTRRLK